MAKRAVKKATAKKGTGRQAARKKNTAKKPIESYDHQDKKRANNPPVGLVTPETDPDADHKKTYEYDPHHKPQRKEDEAETVVARPRHESGDQDATCSGGDAHARGDTRRAAPGDVDRPRYGT